MTSKLVKIPPTNKIRAAQAEIEHSGVRFKHASVALVADQTIADVLGRPEAWTQVQEKLRLAKGDTITLIDATGTTIADHVPIVRAEGGHLWFGKPLRLIQLEEVALWENAEYRVVPNGTGYSIEPKRGGARDGMIYATVGAARAEIERRAPVKVA